MRQTPRQMHMPPPPLPRIANFLKYHDRIGLKLIPGKLIPGIPQLVEP